MYYEPSFSAPETTVLLKPLVLSGLLYQQYGHHPELTGNASSWALFQNIINSLSGARQSMVQWALQVSLMQPGV